MNRRACACAIACVLGLLAPVAFAQAPMMTPKERAARLIARGDRLRASGDSVSASAFYRDAIQVSPRDPAAYVALGETYAEAGELGHAEEAFRVGLQHAGEHMALLLGLVRAYERLGAHERALKSIRAFALARPHEAVLHAERARLTEALGRFIEALSARRMELLVRTAANHDERSLKELQGRIRALELLVASSDRARSPTLCSTTSPIRRALSRCP